MQAIEAAIIAAQNEVRWHDFTARSLSGAGWDAFHLLRDYKFGEARAAIIAALKEFKTRGQLADLRDDTDKLFAEARDGATPDQMTLIVEATEFLAAQRAELVPRLETLYQTLPEVLERYKALQREAKDLLYDRLKF